MKERRLAKISALILRELSTAVNNDFGEQYGLVSVMDVVLSADFESAKVYVSAFDPSQEKKLLTALQAKAFIYQRILADRLKMRSTPKLTFKLDAYQERINQVDKLLQEGRDGA